MYIIAGKYYKQRISAPKGNSTRPTSSRLRETLFNILQNEIEGADFLDIFAGSGAIGIEALSRGAHAVTFIESDRQAYLALQGNLKQLNIEATLLFGDYLKKMEGLQKSFHIIFADAPYHLDVLQELIRKTVINNLLKPSGKLFIENDQPLPKGLDLFGLEHIDSRKSGKSYLHQFQKIEASRR